MKSAGWVPLSPTSCRALTAPRGVPARGPYRSSSRFVSPRQMAIAARRRRCSGRNGRAVSLATCQSCPGDPRGLVGDGHGGDPGGLALSERSHPGPCDGGIAPRSSKDRGGANQNRIPYGLRKSIIDKLMTNPDLPNRWEDLEALIKRDNPNLPAKDLDAGIDAVKYRWEQYVESKRSACAFLPRSLVHELCGDRAPVAEWWHRHP